MLRGDRNHNNAYAKGCIMHYPFTWDEGCQDCDYMKSMYPACTRKMLDVIEDCCDRMEIDGSTMFDIYPDKVRLEVMAKRLYQSLECEKNEWTYAIFKVLLLQEMQFRRGRRTECKRRLQG